jgi:hypothetical protein
MKTKKPQAVERTRKQEAAERLEEIRGTALLSGPIPDERDKAAQVFSTVTAPTVQGAVELRWKEDGETTPEIIEQLINIGVGIAYRGARRYLKTCGLEVDDSTLRQFACYWVKRTWPDALLKSQGKPPDVADTEFGNSMQLAGIEAAKDLEALGK